MKRRHDAPMLVAALLMPAGLAADAATRPDASVRAALPVSATVVRAPAPVEIARQGGAILIRNPDGIGVSIEGGIARPAPGAVLRVEPARGGVTRITLTY